GHGVVPKLARDAARIAEAIEDSFFRRRFFRREMQLTGESARQMVGQFIGDVLPERSRFVVLRGREVAGDVRGPGHKWHCWGQAACIALPRTPWTRVANEVHSCLREARAFWPVRVSL